MKVELGIIEGYYGKPWSWQDRADTVAFLQPHGYTFYHYAPKADPYLRLRWREQYPATLQSALKEFGAHCRKHGVRFGVGLSPVLHEGFDNDAMEALQRKLELFDDVGADDVALLFDDMTGANDSMADQQIEVVHWAAARTKATRILMCPSYYTDDPVLDRVFGDRPAGYVERLGAGLDPKIEVYWTGEEVVSRQISVGHIERVTNTLRRRPFLWDNYPVNDGARMSQYLYVRGFTGRPATLASKVSAHGVNPSLQPTLNRIPCITLAESYAQGERYEYGQAMRKAAREVLGEDLGFKLYQDVLTLQDVGLDRLGEKEAALRERYGNEDHPAAREIIAWLDGEYRITDALVRAMTGNDQG